jgi:hypothetical protein
MAMAHRRLQEVSVQALDAARLEPLIGEERMQRFEQAAEKTRALVDGRSILNVNSTATGGGVAEMLQTLLSYARGAGVDARWLVIQGDPAFFAITKRIHNGLYGSPGDADRWRPRSGHTTSGRCAEMRRRSWRWCGPVTSCLYTIPSPPA